MDADMGYYSGVNEFTLSASHQQVTDVSMYSIMENPMTACGCFECIAMVIPETNGIMIISREDTSMTPAGMTFSTLAGMAGGGLQSPGIMGHGKFYILSPKFISADGGFKRVVWMSSILKEQMAEQLKEVAEREGDPDLISKIADASICTEVEPLVEFLTEKGHPALEMPPIL
jgi:acetyl-CoA synthase